MWIAALVVTLAACSPIHDPGPEPKHPAGKPVVNDLVSDFDFEPYPGSQWYGPDGDEVPMDSNVINAITGPDHCDWQSGVMMHVGWPLGHDAADISESRQYFRDPESVFPHKGFMAKFGEDVKLPREAEDTGFRTDFMELWLVPGDDTAAYLVFSDHVERWPRSKEVVACA